MEKEKRKCICPVCSGTGEIEMVVRISMTDTNKPLAQKLRKEGASIREIAKILGYQHPGSVSHLLSKPKKKKK
jgi:predicted transcriptional regulator